MAENDIQVILRLQAEDKLSPALVRITGELRAMEGASSVASSGASKVNQSFAQLSSTAEGSAKGALGAYALGLKNNATNLEELRGKAISTAREQQQFAGSLKQATAEIEKESGAAQKGASSLGSLSNTVRSMRGNFMLAGGAAALFAVQADVAYEDVLNHVQAFAGATDAEITRYRALIDKMSVQFGLSATDLANSLYSLASAGIHGRDAMIALEVAGKAAAASNTDVAITTDALTTAIKAYGLTGQQIIQAQNDMAQAVKLGKLEYADLASNIGSVIPVAAHLGVTLKDLGDMTVLTTNIGNSAAETFDMERNLLLSLDAPAKQQVKTLQALGLTVEDVSVKHRGLTAVLKTVNDALQQQVPSISEISQRTDLSAKASANLKAQMVEQDQVARRLFGGNQVAMREFFSIYNDGGKSWHATSVQMQHDSTSVNDSWNIASKAPGKHLQEAEQMGMLAARTLGGLLTPALVRVADDFVILGEDAQKVTPHVADFFKEFYVVEGVKAEMNALAGPIIALDGVIQHEAKAQDFAAEATHRHTKELQLQQTALAAMASTDLGSQSFPGYKLAPPPPAPQSSADLVKAMNELGKHLQDLLNQAVAKKYYDVQAGAPKSVIAADTAAVKLAEKNLTDFNKAISTSSDSHKKHVKVIDSLTADLEKTRGRLTKALNDAVAQLVLDERKGAPKSVLLDDQNKVDSAKRSLDGFTKQVDDATRAVKESKSLPLQKQDQNQAQSNYDAALKQAAKDIHDHGSMTVLDKERLLDSKNALDGFTDSTKKAAGWVDRQTKTPLNALQQQDKDRADKQLAFDKAVADGAADLRAGHPITVAHQAAIDKDKASLDRFDKSISDAQHSADKASQAVQTFADILNGLSGDFNAAVGKVAKRDYTGTGSDIIPGAGKAVDDNGNIVRGVGTTTKGQKADDDLYAAAQRLETAYLSNQRAVSQGTAAQIQAAIAAGDLGHAFDLLTQQANTDMAQANSAVKGFFYTNPNATSLPPDLQAQYAAAAAEGAKNTTAEIKGDFATGQYAAGRSLQQNQAQQEYDNLIAKDIPILEAHGQLSQKDIEALQAHRISTDADTQANWDLSYAAASAAEKQNMLSQRFQGLVSQAQQQQGDLQKLDQASLSVMQANSTIQVDKMSELVTETQDQTSIMQAQTEVMKAAGEGQVAALNDATSILQAQESVWKDTQDLLRPTTKDSQGKIVVKSPEEMAIEKQQLVVDEFGVKIQQDKARQDQATANYAVLLARDGVTIQRDKAEADRSAGAAKQVLDQDALKTAIDTQKLTEDEVRLSGIMAEDVDLFTSAMLGVQDRAGEIKGILGDISKDNRTIAADNTQTLQDTTAASLQAQADSLTIANDERRLAADQASAATSGLQGQMQMAQDSYSLEQAKFSLQQLQYQQQVADSQATSNYYQQMFDLMSRTLGFFTSGAFTARYGGSGGAFLNQFSTDYAMQSHATVLA